MKKRPNPDDRSDNVEKIQQNIDHTIKNLELAEERMQEASGRKTQEDLEEKNKRRRDALEGMRREIKDEADARDSGYKD